MSDSVALTAEGTLDRITKDETTGWYTFEIDTGGKWPLKLKTKKSDIVDSVKAHGRAPGVFHYQESDGNINPRTGDPYKNRYISKVDPIGATPVGTTAVAVESSSPVEEQKERVDWDAKERRDFRSRAWAQTISAFAHLIDPEETMDQVFVRLQAFQRKLYQDITGNFAYPADESDLPEALRGGAYDDPDPESGTDDDIPF